MASSPAGQHETELIRSDAPAPPVRTRSSRKRSAIIAAAREVFFQQGYAGASMDRITAEAGVSKATVYNHFRSKEELLMAVVEAVVLPLRDDYLSVMNHATALDEWLLQLGELLARQVLLPDVVALERLVIAEALRFPELGRIFQSIAVDRSFEVLRPRLEWAIAEGEMRPCDPISALGHFAELCVGFLRRRSLLTGGAVPDAAEIKHYAGDAVEVFLRGYAC